MKVFENKQHIFNSIYESTILNILILTYKSPKLVSDILYHLFILKQIYTINITYTTNKDLSKFYKSIIETQRTLNFQPFFHYIQEHDLTCASYFVDNTNIKLFIDKLITTKTYNNEIKIQLVDLFFRKNLNNIYILIYLYLHDKTEQQLYKTKLLTIPNYQTKVDRFINKHQLNNLKELNDNLEVTEESLYYLYITKQYRKIVNIIEPPQSSLSLHILYFSYFKVKQYKKSMEIYERINCTYFTPDEIEFLIHFNRINSILNKLNSISNYSNYLLRDNNQKEVGNKNNEIVPKKKNSLTNTEKINSNEKNICTLDSLNNDNKFNFKNYNKSKHDITVSDYIKCLNVLYNKDKLEIIKESILQNILLYRDIKIFKIFVSYLLLFNINLNPHILNYLNYIDIISISNIDKEWLYKIMYNNIIDYIDDMNNIEYINYMEKLHILDAELLYLILIVHKELDLDITMYFNNYKDMNIHDINILILFYEYFYKNNKLLEKECLMLLDISILPDSNILTLLHISSNKNIILEGYKRKILTSDILEKHTLLMCLKGELYEFLRSIFIINIQSYLNNNIRIIFEKEKSIYELYGDYKIVEFYNNLLN